MDEHLEQVVRALKEGRLVFFLGAGASLCDRHDGWSWNHSQREELPSALELSHHLADEFHVDRSGDLAKVAQQVEIRNRIGPLYDSLQALFDADYPLPSLHRFLAGLPGSLMARGYPRTPDPLRRQLLFVTTNFDDLLERAFEAEGQRFHTLIYQAEGARKGEFLHRLPTGEKVWVESPNDYRGLVDDHPIVLKVHGAVNRRDADPGSFVITEDHYIEYLVRKESAAALFPVPVPSLLKERSLLFLGYGLRDWNLRVILYRVWADNKLSWKSWAIQRQPDAMESAFWQRRDVELIDFPLRDYVAALESRLSALAPLTPHRGAP